MVLDFFVVVSVRFHWKWIYFKVKTRRLLPRTYQYEHSVFFRTTSSSSLPEVWNEQTQKGANIPVMHNACRDISGGKEQK